MTPDAWIQLGILLLIGLGSLTATIKFLVDRMDNMAGDLYKKINEEREAQLVREAALKTLIDSIKETHVRRDDFNRHADRMEAQLDTLRKELSQRLDSVITALGQVVKNGTTQ